MGLWGKDSTNIIKRLLLNTGSNLEDPKFIITNGQTMDKIPSDL